MKQKNIDRLFQEKLKDFEQEPSEAIWKNIERQLDGRQKRRIFPFWYWFGGITAAIALFLLFQQKDTRTLSPLDKSLPNVTVVQNKKQLETKNNKLFREEQTTNNLDVSSKNIAHKKEETIILATSTKKEIQSFKSTSQEPLLNKDTNSKQAIRTVKNKNVAQLDLNESIKTTTANKATFKTNDSLNIVATLKPKKQTIKFNEDKIIAENDVPSISTSNWTVSSIVAPVFFSPFERKGSSIDKKLANKAKNSISNFSYGFRVNYAINDRLSVQTGVHKLALSYSNNDVYVSPSLESKSFSTIASPQSTNVNVTANPTVSPLGSSNQQDLRTSVKGTLYQEFGYIEIPLEIKYKLNNNTKFGLNFFGGISTLFLDANKVSVSTVDYTTNLGKATNLNTLNFSGNIGLDFDYKISKALYFNIAPTLKIQTNTFSTNEGGLKPYFIGVYSGLNFKF